MRYRPRPPRSKVPRGVASVNNDWAARGHAREPRSSAPEPPRMPARHRSSALALRVEPNFLDEAFMPLDTKLDHDVDQEVQQALDVAACQFAAARILLDQQYELLEGEFGAGCMN